MQNLRPPDATSLTPQPSLEPSPPPLCPLSAKPMNLSFTLCCVTGHQGGITPALISPSTFPKLKLHQPCPLSRAPSESKGRKPQGEQMLQIEEQERERKRYHCSLKASRNVPIQFIQAYTRSGRAQDYCEKNLGHI